MVVPLIPRQEGFVTPVGMLISVRLLQSTNAYSPISVTPSGSWMFVSWRQLMNAYFPIFVQLHAEHSIRQCFHDYTILFYCRLFLNQGLANDGMKERFNAEEMELFANGSDPHHYPNVDWQKPATLAPGAKGDLVVRFDPAKAPQPLRRTPLPVGGPDVPPSQRMLWIEFGETE